MAKAVELSNGRFWKTKSAALLHFKNMLGRYSLGDTIDNIDDHDDLIALVRRYDRSLGDQGSKEGIGIARFSKEINVGDGWVSSGFHLHRFDGKSDDFSYKNAVNIDPPDTED